MLIGVGGVVRLGLALGLAGALLEFGVALAAEPDAIPEHPRSSPNEGSEEGGNDRRVVAPNGGSSDMSDVEDEHDRGGDSRTSLSTPGEPDEVERDRRADRRPRRVVERGESDGCRRRRRKDGQRRVASGEEG